MQLFNCSTDTAAISVNIDGATCIVSTVSDTSIECTSGKHLTSLQALVEVFVVANGKAKNVSGTCVKVQTRTNKETVYDISVYMSTKFQILNSSTVKYFPGKLMYCSSLD